MKYSEKGCSTFLTGYLLSFVEDASRAIANPDRANTNELSAWARLQNGVAGHNRDTFIDIVAATAGKASRDVYQALLDQARLKAGKRRRSSSKPAWADRKAG